MNPKGVTIQHSSLIILGAGASGLMLAAQLFEKGYQDMVIVDHNPKAGMKIKVSGGGKCNVTNADVSEDNYLGEKGFVSSVLKQFTPEDLLAFLAARGVVPKIRSLGQYFCQRSADEVINALMSNLPKRIFYLSHRLEDIMYSNEGFVVRTDKKVFKSDYVVVATGSSAYPQVGGSDVGLNLAKKLEHDATDFQPVLVGWTVQKEQFWMKELSGISTQVSIDVGHKKLFGDLLFAHKGISGPAVLSASLYWKKGTVLMDFLPYAELDKLLASGKKQLSNQLGLAKRLSTALLTAIGVEDKPLGQLSSKEREKLALLKAYPLSPAGNFGLKKAEACRGGVSTGELYCETMESRRTPGLYFVGEVVDVTGELGGYNFQWAFASSVVCARALEQKMFSHKKKIGG